MDNHLYHHGIKGMRWGVRRYQNPDGTLTKAGKRRAAENETNHEDYNKAHNNKSIKSMSDAELRAANNRLQMERQYEALTRKTGKGKKVVKAFVAGATTISTVAAAASTYKKFGASAVDKIGDLILNNIDMNIKI